MVAEKLSVYILPRTTGDAFLLKNKRAPVADRFVHSATTAPLLSSVSVTVQLSILVVPDAPLIVKPQVAVVPEKVRLSV